MTAYPAPLRANRARLRPRRVLAVALTTATGLATLAALPVLAQTTATPTLSERLSRPASRDPDARMMVRANEMLTDQARKTVTAQGEVQIYYDGHVLEADRVVYDQASNRVRAYGNVTFTESTGNVFRGETFDLTDDMREGFVQSLLVTTPDKTRFTAAQANRRDGNVTVFDKGIYTACEPCKDNPERPPLWQVRAKRIIHDEQERMVYYEDANLEFFGLPVAYLPVLSHPDPTVKRKTGFLPPHFIMSSTLGYGIEIPFFWNIAPNMDVTLSPTILSNQGLLMQAEFRHRIADGAYSVRVAGINQMDPSAFPYVGGGQEEWRGAIRTAGRFNINEMWSYGWDITALSDRYFLSNYRLWNQGARESLSSVFLEGQGDRNWFSLRGYHIVGLVSTDIQKEQPIAAPVLDYNFIADQPVFGGELSGNINAIHTSRIRTDFEPTRTANASLFPGGVLPGPFDTYKAYNLSCTVTARDCIARGLGGDYSRFSADLQWRRQFIDPIGQVWTPFAFGRGDLIWSNPEDSAFLAPLLNTNQQFFFRGMAGAGLEYRYPFVAASSFGTHLIEPIAQLIVRPNETHIGKFANEDAQSLFFDDSTLFEWDKFSGYDRVEGGTRANIGLQYTLNMPSGAYLNLLFGESFHLLGRNSFATPDLANTGLQSGLDTDRSDYVSRLHFQMTPYLGFTGRVRLDADKFDPKAIEIGTNFNAWRLSGSVVYGRYDPQPEIGFPDAREGVLGSGRVRLGDNWFVSGAARYNIELGKLDTTAIGIGYLDECFGLNLMYSSAFSRDNTVEPTRTVMLSLTLRTLGQAAVSTGLNSVFNQ